MKTALYIRVSTTQQTQSQTIEQQLERLQQHAQQQGWQILPEAIFRDDGYSGATLKRPGLDRLRDQVAMAEIERIVITAPDRLARNFVHQTLLMEEFQQHGVEVEFLDHPMSQDPHDQLLLQIRGAVAEYERTLIAERMRRGRLQKIQAGKLLPWVVPPYGYRGDPDQPRDASRVSLDAAEAAVVSEIFNRYSQRESTLEQVSKYLYEVGIPSPRGNSAWTRASIRGILTNPIYTGQIYANKTRSCPAKQRLSPLKPIGRGDSSQMRERSEWVLVGQIPAIIASDLFEAVQVKLQQNQQTAKRNNKVHSYLLRSLVSCGCCQKTCICSARQPNYRYYHCRSQTNQKRFKPEQPCQARHIPAEQLETLVWNDLCIVLQHPEMIAQAMERLRDGYWLPQELQARQATLQKGQKSLQQQLERLTQAYLGNVLQLEEYRRRRTELETQLQALTVQEKQLATQARQQIVVSQLVEGATDFCQRVKQGLDQATFEQKRQLIELLIDRVVVAHDEVEIRYVFPTHPRGENTHFCRLRLDYFNAKAVAIIVMQLGQSDVQAMDHIEGIANAMLTLKSLEIAADDSNTTGNAAMNGTVERVRRVIAFAPNTEGTSAARFAANHRRQQKRQVQRLELTNHGDRIEAAIHQQGFDPHAQGRQHR